MLMSLLLTYKNDFYFQFNYNHPLFTQQITILQQNIIFTLITHQNHQQTDTFPQNHPQFKVYSLFAIKYNILMKQRKQLQFMINFKNRQITDQYGKEILNFIKQLYPTKYLQEIYYQQLTVLKYLPQYQQISMIIKINSQKLRINSNQVDELTLKTSHQFKKRYDCLHNQQNYAQSKMMNDHLKYGNLVQFLQNKELYFSNKYSAEQYHPILIECLRFDVRNISVQAKIQLAFLFNQNSKIQQQQSKTLNTVRTTFEYLLKYCIQPPSTHWKKQTIFQLLLQIIILDIDILHLVSNILTNLSSMFAKRMEKIVMGIALIELTHIDLLKHVSRSEHNRNQTAYLFYEFGKSNIKCAISQNQITEEDQFQSICNILRQLVQNKTNSISLFNFTQFFKTIDRMSDKNIGKSLKKYTYYIILQNSFAQGDYSKSLQIHNQMKQYFHEQIKERGSVCLHLSVSFNYRMIVMLGNFSELKALAEYFKHIFNCDQVFEMFKFKMNVFLYSQVENIALTKRYSIQIGNASIESLVSHKLSSQVIRMFKKILFYDQKKRQQFIEPIRNLQIKLLNFNSYSQIKKHLMFKEDIQLIMFQVYFFRTFLKIDPSFQITFRQFLVSLQDNINKEIDNRSLIYHNIRYYTFSSNYHLIKNDLPKACFCLDKLLSVANALHLDKLRDYCLISLTENTYNMLDFQGSLKFGLQYYELSVAINSFIRYFETTVSMIYLTLFNFHKANMVSGFYSFLKRIGQFITEYPLLIYFQQLFKQIQQFTTKIGGAFSSTSMDAVFGRIGWNNRYLIIFYVLALDEQNQINKIQLLKRIAVQMDQLSSFALRFIKHKYYQHILNLQQIKNRKKIIIQQKQKNWSSKDIQAVRRYQQNRYLHLSLVKVNSLLDKSMKRDRFKFYN